MYAFLQNFNSAILNFGEENTFFLRQNVFENIIPLKMSINALSVYIQKKRFLMAFVSYSQLYSTFTLLNDQEYI